MKASNFLVDLQRLMDPIWNGDRDKFLIKILIYLVNQVACNRPEIRLSIRGQNDLGLVINSQLLKYHFPLDKYITLRMPSDLHLLTLLRACQRLFLRLSKT